MNQRNPSRTPWVSIAGVIILLSAALQLSRGWNTKEFCLRLLIGAVALVFVWRIRTLTARHPALQPGGTPYRRFIWSIVFWVVAAVVLFLGFRTFG